MQRCIRLFLAAERLTSCPTPTYPDPSSPVVEGEVPGNGHIGHNHMDRD